MSSGETGDKLHVLSNKFVALDDRAGESYKVWTTAVAVDIFHHASLSRGLPSSVHCPHRQS